MDTTMDATNRTIQRIASHGAFPGFCCRMELCEGRPWLSRRFLVELEESAISKASEAKRDSCDDQFEKDENESRQLRWLDLVLIPTSLVMSAGGDGGGHAAVTLQSVVEHAPFCG